MSHTRKNFTHRRVLVDVAVKGEFSERDLVWAVKRALEADGFWQDRKYLLPEHRPVFGTVEVKEFNKVVHYIRNGDSD
jgi:hypothetical protein